jgi:hypothetical protein
LGTIADLAVDRSRAGVTASPRCSVLALVLIFVDDDVAVLVGTSSPAKGDRYQRARVEADRLGDRSDRESCEPGAAMQFAKQLRDRVRRGEITCSVRIWVRPHVKAGGRYSLPPGEIEVDAVIPIQLADLTPALARKSGFRDVDDLLATAKHGRGESVFLVHFHYVPPKRRRSR